MNPLPRDVRTAFFSMNYRRISFANFVTVLITLGNILAFYLFEYHVFMATLVSILHFLLDAVRVLSRVYIFVFNAECE